jgi:hypothetical protein
MTSSACGIFVILLSDGSKCDILTYYCPSLADTIVSPQHFTSSAIHDHRYNGYCLIGMLRLCHILLSHSHHNDVSFIALQKSNNLYFIAGSASSSSGPRVSRLATKPQLLSELWHQRLDHPGPTQLIVLTTHGTGLPSQLTTGLNPMHSCQACNDDKIRRAPIGPVSDTAPLLPGTRFHLDFGFIHASSADFGVSAGNRVVTSYDSNNSYLLIVCAKARQTWIFVKLPSRPRYSSLNVSWH